METLFNFLAVLLVTIINILPGTVDAIRIYNSTAEVPSNALVPRGSTVVLVCTETPTPQQVDYQWTCPNPPCDGQYRKIYGNVLVVVATTATIGQYRCRPTPGSGAATRSLLVQAALIGDQLNIYNNERRLLPNTLIASPEEILNGLTCTKMSGSSYVPRFRRESDSTIVGTRSSHPAAVQAESLQPNGGYRCDAGQQTREFFVYYSKAILSTPQVSVESTTTDQHLPLLLTTPPPYNSGRFILRYDCTLGEADIEVEYRSVDPGVNSNTVVTRSRSCFVVGEISRVTVWFVNGKNISTTPAVVDVACLSCPLPTTSSLAPTTSAVPAPTSAPVNTVTCPADIPSLPAHTKPLSAFTSPPPAGTRIRIGCERGYFSEDQQTLECGPQGQWIGDVQQCTETCSSQNLTALFGALSYELPVLIRPGALVSPQCREGYQVAVSAVCHVDTTWRLQGQCVQGTTEAIVIGATTANLLILLLSITLLVISGVLIVKSRKRHTSTLHSTSQVTFDEESKEPAVQIYDEIDDSAKTTTKHTAGVYQDLNINNMDTSNQYSTMRT